jgi:ABC-type phosphate transport system substrate-binding protein
LVGVAALLVSAAPGISSAPAANDTSFVVIVASANPASSIRRQTLASFFLKKTSRWNDGGVVMPVDQSASSPVRNAFTRDVLSVEGMDKISAVQEFWLQQLYSGRNAPPPVKSTDAEVVAFVASNPGAIAYVGAVPAGGGVKALAITE